MSPCGAAAAPAWLFRDTPPGPQQQQSAAWRFSFAAGSSSRLLPQLQQTLRHGGPAGSIGIPFASITAGSSTGPSSRMSAAAASGPGPSPAPFLGPSKSDLQSLSPLSAPFTGPTAPEPDSSSGPMPWPDVGTAPDVFKAGEELQQQRYKLLEKIADGRFTSIWAASDRQQQQERPVVIKMMEGGDDNSRVAGTREALMHALAGSHPGVVPLLDAFEEQRGEGHHVGLVEPQEGDNLASVMHRYAGGVRMGLPLPAVQSIATQLLGALQHLHARGLVHMAVKPENILLDQPFVSIHEVNWDELLRHQAQELWRWITRQPLMGAATVAQRPGCYNELDLHQARVKLTDFGRSLNMEQWDQWVDQEEVIVWGQPGHRSPEEMLHIEYRRPAYDIWQLGLTCYCLATGQDLFAPDLGPDYDLTDKHLGELTGVLGRLPREFARRSPVYQRYFCPSGRLALELEYRVAQEPLEQVLQQEHGFEEEEAQEFGGFLRSLLVYDPVLRPTAEEALQHPWLVTPLDPEQRQQALEEQQRKEAEEQRRRKRGWLWFGGGRKASQQQQQQQAQAL